MEEMDRTFAMYGTHGDSLWPLWPLWPHPHAERWRRQGQEWLVVVAPPPARHIRHALPEGLFTAIHQACHREHIPESPLMAHGSQPASHGQPAPATATAKMLPPYHRTTHGPWPPSCLVQPCQPTALHHLDATVDSLLDGGTVTRAPAAHNTTTMVPPSHSLQKGKGGLGDRGREGSVRAKDKGLVWCVVLCLCLSSCLSFVRICRRRLPPHTHTVASSKTPPRYCGQPSTLCIPCCSSLLPPHVVCNVTFIRTPKVFVAAGRQMAGARIHGGAREKSKQTRRRAFRLSGSRCSCLSETRSVACAARRGRETMRAKAPVRPEAVVGIASWPLHMTGLSPLCPPHVMAVWRTQLQYGQYRENESEHRVCWTGHRPTLSSPP